MLPMETFLRKYTNIDRDERIQSCSRRELTINQLTSTRIGYQVIAWRNWLLDPPFNSHESLQSIIIAHILHHCYSKRPTQYWLSIGCHHYPLLVVSHTVWWAMQKVSTIVVVHNFYRIIILPPYPTIKRSTTVKNNRIALLPPLL